MDMRTRPFLKWAGSKYRILDHILARLPAGARLIEPFAGSAAVFMNAEYDRYLLADTNADLIALYQTLKREGPRFIEYCRSYFTPEHNRPEAYYALRDAFNASDDPTERSALFVYLNRHGYNGLCRYNSAGRFNVPIGRYQRPYFPEREMEAFWRKARHARFRHGDFAAVMDGARAGDVIYCDPPYVPLSASANFTSYAAGGFGLPEQERLAACATRAAARGVPVLISNHNTAFTRRAYRGAKLSKFPVRRFISCNGSKRDHARELLALFSRATPGET